MYTKGHGGKSRGMAVNVVYTKMHNAEGSARTVWVSIRKGEKEEKRKWKKVMERGLPMPSYDNSSPGRGCQ